MPDPRKQPVPDSPQEADLDLGITPRETLEYTKEQVEILQKIAARQGHQALAQLLGLAAREAGIILRDQP